MPLGICLLIMPPEHVSSIVLMTPLLLLIQYPELVLILVHRTILPGIWLKFVKKHALLIALLTLFWGYVLRSVRQIQFTMETEILGNAFRNVLLIPLVILLINNVKNLQLQAFLLVRRTIMLTKQRNYVFRFVQWNTISTETRSQNTANSHAPMGMWLITLQWNVFKNVHNIQISSKTN